jgi:SAM-dependent methyltransferase
MVALFLEDVGRLVEPTEALAVGAGDERILFWLANRVGRVVATDIYGEGTFAGQEAPGSMLTDPASHSPFPYREDRLDVRFMDARKLDFPDESFDVAFSVSSFEHFGGPEEIVQAAHELGRVLRPGGHAVIVTECWVRLHPLNTARIDYALKRLSGGRLRKRAAPDRRGGVDVLTAEEIRAQIVEPSGLRMLQPLDLSLSERSWDNVTRLRARGEPQPRSGSFYPHVLLRFRMSTFTSACVVLEKPG